MPGLEKLKAMSASFAAVEICAGISQLPAGERRAPVKPAQAGRIMDALFLRHVWAGNGFRLPEAERNCRESKELIARPGVVRPNVRNALDELRRAPADIEAGFATADALAAQ